MTFNEFLSKLKAFQWYLVSDLIRTDVYGVPTCPICAVAGTKGGAYWALELKVKGLRLFEIALAADDLNLYPEIRAKLLEACEIR